MLEKGWQTFKIEWKAELRSILRIQSTYNANCFFTLGIVHHPSINTYKNFWVLKGAEILLMISWPWFYSQNLHCDTLTKLQQSSWAFKLHHVHILTIFELIGMANTGVNCCWGSILHLLPTVHFENDDDRSLLDNFIFMLCQICQC